MRLFKVECAEDGKSYTIRLDADDTITKFKTQLSLFVSISPQDQILLIGPPYKRLDTQFGPYTPGTEESKQRIFLYNRQMLSGQPRQPVDVRLQPYEILPPEDISHATMSTTTNNVAALLEQDPSPLVKALPDFERQFLRNLFKGKALVATCEKIVDSCKRCASEQKTQTDAVEAALSNLKDHYNTNRAAFLSSQEKLTTQQLRHKQLLDNFENDLAKLGTVSLHPALASIATSIGLGSLSGSGTGMGGGGPGDVGNLNPSSAGSRSVSTSSSRLLTGAGGGADGGSFSYSASGKDKPNKGATTLLDCLPADRERAWAKQCATVHTKVNENLYQLQEVIDQVSSGISGIAINPLDPATAAAATLKRLEDMLTLQRDSYARLQEDYQFVYDMISHRVGKIKATAAAAASANTTANNATTTATTVATAAVAASTSSLSSSSSSSLSSSFSSSGILADATSTATAGTGEVMPSAATAVAVVAPRSGVVPPLTSVPDAATDASCANNVNNIDVQNVNNNNDNPAAAAHTPSSSSRMAASYSSAAAVMGSGGGPLAGGQLVGVESDDGDVVTLLRQLESRRRQQESDLLQQMVLRCNQMMEMKDVFAAEKSTACTTVLNTMRAITVMQTEIQYKFKKGLEMLKKWQQGHNEYFSHLEHVARLPEAYDSLLLEIVRRRAFNNAYEARISVFSNEIAAFRSAETSRREEFMRSQGAHLPPLFFHMVPSLKEKPPFFNPTLTEAQWLPEVYSEDCFALTSSIAAATAATAAATSTTDSNNNNEEEEKHSSALEGGEEGSSIVPFTDSGKDQRDRDSSDIATAATAATAAAVASASPHKQPTSRSNSDLTVQFSDVSGGGSVIFHPLDLASDPGAGGMDSQGGDHRLKTAARQHELEYQNALLMGQVVELQRQLTALRVSSSVSSGKGLASRGGSPLPAAAVTSTMISSEKDQHVEGSSAAAASRKRQSSSSSSLETTTETEQLTLSPPLAVGDKPSSSPSQAAVAESAETATQTTHYDSDARTRHRSSSGSTTGVVSMSSTTAATESLSAARTQMHALMELFLDGNASIRKVLLDDPEVEEAMREYIKQEEVEEASSSSSDSRSHSHPAAVAVAVPGDLPIDEHAATVDAMADATTAAAEGAVSVSVHASIDNLSASAASTASEGEEISSGSSMYNRGIESVRETYELVEKSKGALVQRIQHLLQDKHAAAAAAAAVTITDEDFSSIANKTPSTPPRSPQTTAATHGSDCSESTVIPVQLPVQVPAPPLTLPSSVMLSIRDFKVGSVVLFMPLSPEKDFYLAFHHKCPHRFLSPESLQLFKSFSRRPNARLDYVIGRVVYIETLIAEEGNTFTLQKGTEYHFLHVEKVDDAEMEGRKILPPSPYLPQSAAEIPVDTRGSSESAPSSPSPLLKTAATSAVGTATGVDAEARMRASLPAFPSSSSFFSSSPIGSPGGSQHTQTVRKLSASGILQSSPKHMAREVSPSVSSGTSSPCPLMIVTDAPQIPIDTSVFTEKSGSGSGVLKAPSTPTPLSTPTPTPTPLPPTSPMFTSDALSEEELEQAIQFLH